MKRHQKKYVVFLWGICIILVGIFIHDEGIPRMQYFLSYYDTVDSSKSTKDNFSLAHIRLLVDGRVVSEKSYFTEQFAKDRVSVKNSVCTLNKSYLSSLLSGECQIFSREYCTTKEIYQEVNARCLYQMESYPSLGKGVRGTHLEVNFHDVDIQGDVAKVIIKRQVELQYADESKGEQKNEQWEGYLLKKEEGTWKIENVIFTEEPVERDNPMPIYLEKFAKNKQAQEWQNIYGFTQYSRKTYLNQPDYKDYFVGKLPNAVIDTKMIQSDLVIAEE